MTTDSEIAKQFWEFNKDSTMEKAAIRLWRMAEDEQEMRLDLINTDIAKKLIAEARADERRKAHDIEFEKMAKAILVYKQDWINHGIKKGQAKLIEKLTKEYGRGQICDGCIHAIQLASESASETKPERPFGAGKSELCLRLAKELAKPENAHIHRFSRGNIKHITQEGARFHVHRYSSVGAWCSEYDCEDNKDKCECGETKPENAKKVRK
jgi:hypothetical protein